MLLLNLLVSNLAYLLFFFLLLELQVEGVHHLLPKVFSFLLVFFLGLHADLQVVSRVAIFQATGPAFFDLMDIFGVYPSASDELLMPGCFFFPALLFCEL